MEPGARGRSPVSRRVAQKLGNDPVLYIPYRPRNDAAFVRKTAAADLDTVTARHHDSEADPRRHPAAAADALSLSGTTPPSSPTMTNFPAASKSMTPESAKATRPHLVLIDTQGKVAAKDGDDASFRKHNRGIGSIDSLLSSTTYVNTQSECSRAESRLSREIRIEAEDTDDGAPIAPHRKPRKQTSRIQLAPPSIASHGASMTHSETEGLDDEDEEARLVDEISSWVLRNAFGKDMDDCAAPLLVWDCTYRYLQELWTASHEGNFGFVQSTSGHGTPSPHYGGTPGSGGGDQQHAGHHGKGKRKADGGSDDGSGFGGRDNQGNEERDASPASQAYSTKGNTTNFSCPYRKRNPLRFNVRDYYVCATHSFADMSQLKKHIRAHHPPVQRNAGLFHCPRCGQGFVSKTDLDSHLRQVDVCHVSFDSGGADPEDGITQKIISSLEARSLKAKIDNWVSLWKLLFPADRTIPDPVFVPVMEIYDFVAESKKFLAVLSDLLGIQYQHVLGGATEVMNVELKIRQGIERSTGSIYNWIETVVQDWEQRIAGTVSLFTSSAISQPATSDSWASTPHLPPSPAPTTTVVPGNAAAATSSTLPGAESPGAPAPAGLRGTGTRRRPIPAPKRIKRPEILPKAPPPTQIPLPIQRARTPQSQARVVSNAFRPPPTVLPSQSVPLAPSTTQGLNPGQPYHTSWETPAVTVTTAYPVPYTSPGDVFQHPAMPQAHYGSMHQNQLDVQAAAYLGSEQSDTMSPDAMQHDIDPRPQSAATIHANRLTMSTTPRSSLASLLWNRDENRDSSQTLVEPHPAGRCGNMYCPSCNKTMPDDMAAQPSPVGIHPVTGAPHHHVFHTAGPGQGGPYQPSPSPNEVHGFTDQVEWYAVGGGHGTGGNDNMFGGGHHGPREGY